MKSVFANNYPGLEYIIIDGGSTDGSLDYVKTWRDNLAYWVSEKDAGVYDAMNKGIQKVSGKYIMFLNSGDCLTNEKILSNISKVVAGANADIFYGNMLLEKEHNKIEELNYPGCLTLDFWKHATINHQSAFIKATLFKEMGLYDTRYNLAADYAFFLKCFFNGKHFHHVDAAWVRFDTNGISSLDKALYKKQMNEAWKKTIPVYLDKILNENQAHKIFMNHRLMRWASNFNEKYNRLKNEGKIGE